MEPHHAFALHGDRRHAPEEVELMRAATCNVRVTGGTYAETVQGSEYLAMRREIRVMRFHVTINVHDAIVLDEADRRFREVFGPQLQRILRSEKVQGGGFLGGRRGAFFVLDVDEPEELYSVLGPETYGNCTVEAHPIIPWQAGEALFQQWAAEGR